MNVIHSSNDVEFLNLIKYPEITIKENEFAFISGKSGCGKSTYLKMLNKMISPSKGNIYYRGKNINNYPVLDYRREVLLVPQEVFLLDGSIRDNFDFYYNSIEKKKLTDYEMNKYLKISSIEFSSSVNCKNLSGGERKRIFLSIFLSCASKVLLLDEPTSSLDEKTSITVLSNIKNFCKENNITSICVCHDENLINIFSENTIKLGENL